MEATFCITPKEAGIRIDLLCAKKFPNVSRSRWTKHGTFLANDIAKTPKTKAKLDETWLVQCETEPKLSTDLKPWDFPLKILAESKTWVAIEKPKGIAVHPSLSAPDQTTIINALVHHFGQNLSENFDQIEGRDIPRPGLVHRLDKTTSGVLLIAKTNATHKYFQDHWTKCQKIYRTIVKGKTPPKGRIEGAIYRDPKNRKKMSVVLHEKAKSALTLFETLDTENGYSDLEVAIMTGRTHQIRVQLSSIEFPVFCDSLFDDKRSARMYVHAQTLAFPDPDNDGKTKIVESEMPWDFLEVVS